MYRKTLSKGLHILLANSSAGDDLGRVYKAIEMVGGPALAELSNIDELDRHKQRLLLPSGPKRVEFMDKDRGYKLVSSGSDKETGQAVYPAPDGRPSAIILNTSSYKFLLEGMDYYYVDDLIVLRADIRHMPEAIRNSSDTGFICTGVGTHKVSDMFRHALSIPAGISSSSPKAGEATNLVLDIRASGATTTNVYKSLCFLSEVTPCLDTCVVSAIDDHGAKKAVITDKGILICNDPSVNVGDTIPALSPYCTTVGLGSGKEAILAKCESIAVHTIAGPVYVDNAHVVLFRGDLGWEFPCRGCSQAKHILFSALNSEEGLITSHLKTSSHMLPLNLIDFLADEYTSRAVWTHLTPTENTAIFVDPIMRAIKDALPPYSELYGKSITSTVSETYTNMSDSATLMYMHATSDHVDVSEVAQKSSVIYKIMGGHVASTDSSQDLLTTLDGSTLAYLDGSLLALL